MLLSKPNSRLCYVTLRNLTSSYAFQFQALEVGMRLHCGWYVQGGNQEENRHSDLVKRFH